MTFLQTHSPQVKGEPGLGTALPICGSLSHTPSSCVGPVLRSWGGCWEPAVPRPLSVTGRTRESLPRDVGFLALPIVFPERRSNSLQ